MKKLEKCTCGSDAVWLLMSASEAHSNPFYCDNCVPRGCSCNMRSIDISTYDSLDNDMPEGIENKDWRWVSEDTENFLKYWTYIDEFGREYPCCEFDYEEDGFDFIEKV